jgi:hypothetical protein
MTTNRQSDQNEMGHRIARHAAMYCGMALNFQAASLIARAWGVYLWGAFIQQGP